MNSCLTRIIGRKQKEEKRKWGGKGINKLKKKDVKKKEGTEGNTHEFDK